MAMFVSTKKTGAAGLSDADDRLRDFSTDSRLLLLVAMALVIGTMGAAAAWVLLHLIYLVTNIAYYGRFDAGSASIKGSATIAGHTLGWFSAGIPVVGCLIIGLMARYGSEKIRGHGIPEAMEAILIGRSRIEAKVAILKPLSSAISIGTGGPFGAEGPIIMTGGAFGSLFAQLFHLSNAERKTLLVAGAAAGMTATFGTPVAAMLLAVELLLFEWKPRSFVPVAVASVVAAVWRPCADGTEPALSDGGRARTFCALGLLLAAALGIVAGLASGLLTQMVYTSEDLFQRLPIHWMWWPMFGGVVIGIGGLIEPHALGVGYDNIAALLNGDMTGMAVAASCRREGDHLVGRARLRHVGRRAGAAAHHGWRARRVVRPHHADGQRRHLGAARHGGDDGRHDALAADRDRLRDRAHA